MDNQQLAINITKALGYTENGGKPDINNTKAGKTGEAKSIFQFEPATWKAYSKQVSGQDLPLTPDNETKVVTAKVSKWLQEGHTPEQIASMWNAGPGEQDAYTGKFSDGSASSGVNKKYGVKYDVPGYVTKFKKYLGEFEGGKSMEQPQQDSTSESTPQTSSGNAPTDTPQSDPKSEAIKDQMVDLIQKNKPAPQAATQSAVLPKASLPGMIS